MNLNSDIRAYIGTHQGQSIYAITCAFIGVRSSSAIRNRILRMIAAGELIGIRDGNRIKLYLPGGLAGE